MADPVPDSRSSSDSTACPAGRVEVLRRKRSSRELARRRSARMVCRHSITAGVESRRSQYRQCGAEQATTLWPVSRSMAPRRDNTVPRDSERRSRAPDHSYRANRCRKLARTANRIPCEGMLQPGAELAGFRIILELGRGAFARVYLAEEINLGRRLVAVKVSRPDGDEPRILARLQHAHIVPVHSVHDDPATGQRFLCMPYFGGADLARVLRASGGLVPTRHDGGSLVKALTR